MSQLAMILGRFAPGHKLDHAGKTYEFGVISRAQRVAIEKAWRKRLADLAREYHAEGELDDAQLAAELAGLRKRYERGEFDLVGAGGHAMAHCYDGRVMLLQHIATVTPQGGASRPASAEEAETLAQARTLEVTELITMVYMESFPEIKQKALAMEKLAQGEAEAEAAQKHQ